MRCALVTGSPHEWLTAVALASPQLEFSVPPGFPNPLGLPQEDRPDVVLLAVGNPSTWCLSQYPGWLRRLERYGAVVGLDGMDWFELGFAPAIVERLALVIKGQGIYRDRELYNYRVGPSSGGANWTRKITPREKTYRSTDLDKLRLSVPCFAADLPPIKRCTRKREGGPGRSRQRPMSHTERLSRNAVERVALPLLRLPLGRPHQVHRVYSLTHTQRLDVLRRLDGLEGASGISGIPPNTIGTDSSPETLRAELRPLMRPPEGRLRYVVNLHRHKVAVAPTGYGELTFRHGEAWRTGTALVCQNLDHVEVMFPVENKKNVLYCHHDLSNLREVVQELLVDDRLRHGIATQGRADYLTWARDWRGLISAGLERHLHEFLGMTSQVSRAEG